MGLMLALLGLDGSGKSTQAKRLCELCRQNGMSADIIHLKMVGTEKYIPEAKKKLKEYVARNHVKDKKEICNICSALIFCEKVQDKIIPSLSSNDITIIDRYRDSALCYQYLADGVYPSVQQIYDKLITPDLNFFLDLQPDECYKRITVRKELSIYETPEYLEKSYIFYRAIREKFIWVDASKEMNDITQLLFSTLQELCKK